MTYAILHLPTINREHLERALVHFKVRAIYDRNFAGTINVIHDPRLYELTADH